MHVIQHHHMSQDYEQHAAPQQTVGRRALNELSNLINSYFHTTNSYVTAVDLACGPGNLTVELRAVLKKLCPQASVHLMGLDLTPEGVGTLVERSNYTVDGLVASFYQPGLRPNSLDVVHCNEGLHWQPNYGALLSEFFYLYCPYWERVAYCQWAHRNLQQSFNNIYNLLKPGGVAVIQMGRQNQIQAFWDLMQQTILSLSPFYEYRHYIQLPLYYPSVTELHAVIQNSGFNETDYQIECFDEDFIPHVTNDRANDVTQAFRAFSESALNRAFPTSQVDYFYQCMEAKLRQCHDLYQQYIHHQWRRTIITLYKRPILAKEPCAEFSL